MAGTGTITLTVSAATRAQWDAFVAAMTTFKSNHPEVQSVTFQYLEQSVQ